MRTPASIGGIPLHAMLSVLPLGLWTFALACDLAYVLGVGASLWFTLGFYTMIAGMAGALLAAVPGLVDLVSLHDAPRRTGFAHLWVSVLAIASYAVNIALRVAGHSVAGLPLVLSIAGYLLLVTGAMLGWRMVYRHGVGSDAPDRQTR